MMKLNKRLKVDNSGKLFLPGMAKVKMRIISNWDNFHMMKLKERLKVNNSEK